MKKLKNNLFRGLLFTVLGASMLLTLSACGNNENANTASPTLSQNTAPSEPEVPSSQTTDGDDGTVGESNGKIVIAYFTAAENSEVDVIASASVTTRNGEAKGRVRAVADMIHIETGGELFSILTSVEYPGDGRELIDFAAEEQDNNARPKLTSHIESLDDYDTIFIGYPNWWYDMPMVMYSFFEEYDFSGKTIIPFNVHNGSRFSSTIEMIQELEPDATVIKEGFTVSERDVADAAGDVADWLQEIGY